MKEMEGKTCLITGATSGIGSSAALKLSDMGADICFIARSQEKAKNLGEKIFKISGKEPLAIIADLSSQEEIRRAAEEFIQSNKPIDVLLKFLLSTSLTHSYLSPTYRFFDIKING